MLQIQYPSFQHPPIVLVFGGNDPTGGAGLCADIQALTHQGCHTAPIITCITPQNTHDVMDNFPLPTHYIKAQAEAVLTDLPVTLCKIGLIGNLEILETIQELLTRYRLPTVLDPILSAGGGHPLTQAHLRQAMIQKLLPLVQILTPNSQEARRLTGQDSLPLAAQQLMDWGCQYVCITGSHENTPQVINQLYGGGHYLQQWEWSRLPDTYHGSGCTFAASLAGALAKGKEMITAVYDAQQYTWQTLQQGYQASTGQAFPRRF